MTTDDETAAVRRLTGAYANLLGVHDGDSVLELIADAFQTLLAVDALVVYRLAAAGKELTATVRRGPALAPQVVADGQGEVGRAAAGRTPCGGALDLATDIPGRRQALPLVANGKVLGVVDLVRLGSSATFGPVEVELGIALAQAAAMALDNALARERLELLTQTDPLTGLFNHRHFHERLGAELSRARRSREPVAVVLLDIDDFKRVNDIYGHGCGDALLVRLGELLRAAVRGSDVVCRVGGEEFAVIMPACEAEGALIFAARVAAMLEGTAFDEVGHVTVSAGIAIGPFHALNPRELVACADDALMSAKARGKDRALVFEDGGTREIPAETRREVRSISHMKMLQNLAGRLNRLRDVNDIGAAVVEELRALVAYHACRVYVLRDGRLNVIGAGSEGCARCDDAHERSSEPCDELVVRAVEERRPQLLVRAGRCGHQGESIAVVPLTHGADSVGAVEVLKAGADTLDGDDVRLLEVLAGQASVALVNARLYEELRQEAEHAKALVRFGDKLSGAQTLAAVIERSAEGLAGEVGAHRVSVWLPAAPGAEIDLAAAWGYPAGEAVAAELATTRRVVSQVLRSLEPFSPLPLALCPVGGGPELTLLLAPLAIDGGRIGAAALVVGENPFSDAHLRLLAGLGANARLAIAKASELDLLRHTYLRTVAALENLLAGRGSGAASVDHSRVA